MITRIKISFLIITCCVAFPAVLFSDGHAPSTIGPEAALAKLREGNQRFATGKVTSGKDAAGRRAETAQAQHPFAIVIACSDSRTPPELLFDENIGDIFVVRTAGNLVDEHGLGSIEYAVEHLGARLVVVLGHERCGAVTAAVQSKKAPGHIHSLVRDLQPAVKAAKRKTGDAIANTVMENTQQMAKKIRAEAEFGHAEVRVVTGIYDLDTGVVAWGKD